MSRRKTPKSRRVVAQVPEEVAIELEQWATEETRSLSGLCVHLLSQAVQRKKSGEKPSV